jgi:hypothetical protein
MNVKLNTFEESENTYNQHSFFKLNDNIALFYLV